MQQVVPERVQRPVNVRPLPAGMAKVAGQLGAAVEAVRLMRVAVAPHPRQARPPGPTRRPSPRHRSLRDPASDFPLKATLCAASALMLAAAGMKRIGLLGGSFNPAHRGHRRISLAAMEALGLDEVWWLVSPGNPLKAGAQGHGARSRTVSPRRSDGAALAHPRQRFRAARGHALHRRHGAKARSAAIPMHRFIWLMGADTVAEFHQWKDWRKLAESLPIAVISRPGYDRQAHAARAMGWLRRFVRPSSQAKNWTDWSAPAILFLRLPPDPTSATGLRALDPNWHKRFPDPDTGSKRFALPTLVRRALARSSH